MHEVAIISETIELAVAKAREVGAERIQRLTMRVGALSGAAPEALAFAFDVVATGSIAEGATLEFERVPVTCWCPNCDASFVTEDLLCVCPTCGRTSADVRGGRELQLVSLEVS